MSYMGAMGAIMSGSGLTDLWSTVYAPNSVIHMSQGHAYERALKAHLLTAVTLVTLMLETPGCLSVLVSISIDSVMSIACCLKVIVGLTSYKMRRQLLK